MFLIAITPSLRGGFAMLDSSDESEGEEEEKEAAPEEAEEVQEEAAPVPDKEQVVDKILSLLREFLMSNDAKEAVLCISELGTDMYTLF